MSSNSEPVTRGSRGIAQVLLGCRLFSQLSESSVAKFLLHALSEFVRLAQKAPGPQLLGAFALVVHVAVRSRATQRSRSPDRGERR